MSTGNPYGAQPNMPQPAPQSSSGCGTVTIVLAVLGVLFLVCGGICAGTFFFVAQSGGALVAVGTGAMEGTMAVQNSPAVREKLGAPVEVKELKQETLTAAKGNEGFLEMRVVGSKGQGMMHIDMKRGGQAEGWTVDKMEVRCDDGTVIPLGSTSAPPEDAAEIQIPDVPELEKETDDTEMKEESTK